MNLENPFHMPLDESAPSMRTSIEFSEYSSCFWENGNTKSILAGQVDVIGNIIDVIFNTQAYDSIAGNSKEVLVSIFGTYDIATAEDSPLQILMKDESASRYDLAFSGLGGAFKLTANIDASQISLLSLLGADLSEIISMLKNSVKGYEIIVYVPETTDEFSATVTDPSTGDSKRLSWNSISLGEKTNSINEDALFAIVDEFSKTVSNVSYDAATFFKDLNSALVDGKTDDGQLEITNFGTLAVVDDELKFELMLNGYSCGTENPATGTVVITFQDKESGGDFTSIDADITCSIEGFDFSGRGYVLGNMFSSQEPIQFTMSADKVASITANDNGIYTIGIQTLNDIDMELLF